MGVFDIFKRRKKEEEEEELDENYGEIGDVPENFQQFNPPFNNQQMQYQNNMSYNQYGQRYPQQEFPFSNPSSFMPPSNPNYIDPSLITSIIQQIQLLNYKLDMLSSKIDNIIARLTVLEGYFRYR